MAQFHSHSDVIQHLWHDIVDTFDSLGAVAPDQSDIFPSNRWRYVRTSARKDRKKIGFKCTFDYFKDTPVVKITVHSFKGGGQSAYFNSLATLKKQQLLRPALEAVEVDGKKRLVVPASHQEDTAYTDALLAEQQARDLALSIKQKEAREKERQERLRLKQRFDDGHSAWRAGDPESPDLIIHPYVKHKNINHLRPLRILKKTQNIGFLLHNLDGEITGIQQIKPDGFKLIYGKKKGSFAVLGDLKEASKLFFCEGYATASSILDLVIDTERHPSECAVVICLDASNLSTIVTLMAKHAGFKNKKFVICPDNDDASFLEGKGNAGLLAGYSAVLARNHNTEMRIPPEMSDGSDWCDYLQKMRRNEDLLKEAKATFKEKTKEKVVDLHLKRLECFKDGDHSITLRKAIISALNHYCHMLYPHKINENDYIASLLEQIKHTKIEFKDVRFWWSRIKRRRFAIALRATTFKKEQASPIQQVEVDSMADMLTQVRELKKQHQKAIFITNAPMGQGKTQQFMQPEFELAESQSQLPIIITPVRSLTQSVSQRFNCAHYIDDDVVSFSKDQTTIAASLAITINSIINKKYHSTLSFSQSLFIDEYTQVLRSITSGTVDNMLRHDTEKRLTSLINQVKYCYLADADFNQIAIDHLIQAVTDERPIFIFRLKQPKEAGRAFVAGHAMKANTNDEKASNDTQLAKLQAQQQPTILGQARLGQTYLLAKDPKDIAQTIKDKKQHQKQYVIHLENDPNLSSKLLLRQIIKQAKHGKKLYIVSDSKKKLDMIAEALSIPDHTPAPNQQPISQNTKCSKDNHTQTSTKVFRLEDHTNPNARNRAGWMTNQSIKVLSLNSDTVNLKEQQAFAQNPDQYLKDKQPNIVLVSPAVQSGISIETDYFDRCFGLYGGTVSPIVFQQMLHRVRTQNTFHLSLPNYTASKARDIENPTALLMAAYQQTMQQFGLQQMIFDPKTQLSTIATLSIKNDEGKLTIEGDDDYQRYERLSAEIQAMDNQQTNNATAFLLLQAMCRKIKLRYVTSKVHQKVKSKIKADIQLLNEYTQAKQQIELAGQVNLNEEEYNRKKRQSRGGQSDRLTNQDLIDIKRYEINDDLHLSENSVSIDDVEYYQNKGQYHVANYQAMLNGYESAQKNDQADKDKGVAKTNAQWRAVKVQLLNTLFEQLEIDKTTGAGSYDKTKAQKTRDVIRKDEALNRYVTFKLNLEIDGNSHDVAFINKLFKKLLGLQCAGKQVRIGEEDDMIYDAILKEIDWYTATDMKLTRQRIYQLDRESFNSLRHYFRLKTDESYPQQKGLSMVK